MRNEKCLLTFQNFNAFREVWIIFRVVGTIKFLFSLVTNAEFLACVWYVPHLTTYNVIRNERSRRCAGVFPSFPKIV